jgi:CheY-like chemotaxis protein
MKILVVEDENLNQIVIKEMLRNLYPNFQVDLVNNGIEALEILTHENYDLILSDIDMPKMNGNEFLSEVRHKLKLNTPIIAVTAYAITGDRERLLLYGFDNYISKPLEITDLKKVIDSYLHTQTINVRFFENINSIETEADEQYVAFITESFMDSHTELFEISNNRIVAGAIVPHLIKGKELISEGIGLLKLEKGTSFLEVANMKEMYHKTLESKLTENQSTGVFLFVDGLSSQFDTFISNLNEIIDSDKTSVLGSGVGVKNLIHQPVIFDQNGIYTDHALVIGTNFKVNANVHHGWHSMYGPLVVTKSQDNIIYELNGEKAFDVYQRTLKEIENIDISSDNFFEIAKGHPLGIMTFSDNEFIIRDPITNNNDGSITIVSSVNEYDSLYIMKGEKTTLIDSSKQLSKQVFSKSIGKTALLFDCISRVLFLEEDFQKELDALSPIETTNTEEYEVFGLTCIGEITNAQFNNIKVLNKTTLLGTIA